MLTTIEDVQNWLLEITREFGFGFHPDDNFSDYIGLSPERAAALDSKLSKAHEICQTAEVDICEIGIVAFKAHNPEFSRHGWLNQKNCNEYDKLCQ